ncbi:MAG: aromatic amino acid lyase, partial [Bacteroidales bacterium]
MNTFEITTKNLDFDQIEEIIENGYKLKLSEEVIDKIQKCRDYLDKKMENQKEPIYGVTTGFGSL